MRDSARTVQEPLRRTWRWIRPMRRACTLLLIVLTPFALLAAVGAGVAYVRLANGPVSLSYLKPAIETQIKAKLGLGVSISDVVLSLAGPTAEFRLKDVRVTDSSGRVVAQAPLATMEIDRGSLFRGQVSPTGIILIRPIMRLSYSAGDGLSLSFRRSASLAPLDAPKPAPPTTTATMSEPTVIPIAGDRAATPAGTGIVEQRGSITVLRSIAALLADMRSTGSKKSLDRLGVRNALIEIEQAGSISRWGVPTGDLQFRHDHDRSAVTGLGTIVESEGQNITLSFSAEATGGGESILLRGSARNVQPRALGRAAPALSAIEALDAPLSAEASFNLSTRGDIVDGRVTIEVGPGSLRTRAGLPSIIVDHGRIVVGVNRDSSVLSIEPSTLAWGRGNELVVGGSFSPVAAVAGGSSDWAFDLASIKGRFVDRTGAATTEPVGNWQLKGKVRTAAGAVRIDEASMTVAGGSLFVAGTIGGDERRVALEGRIGPGPVRALAYLWPETVAADARNWMHTSISAGQISGGQFAASWSLSNDASSAPAGTGAYSQSLTLSGHDLRVVSPVTPLPLYLEKALVRVEGNQVEFSAPVAVLEVRPTRSIALKQVKLEVADMFAAKPVGELSLKASGKLRDAMAVLRTSTAGGNLSAALPDGIQRVQGSVEGRMRIGLPLYQKPDWAPAVTGQFTVKDLSARDVLAKHDLSGGVLKLQIGERSVNIDGELLVAGVASQITWQYILDAALQSQPPLRLKASLDDVDRNKLGIEINHIVGGLVDVDVNLVPLAGGRFGSKVLADLTKAEVSVASLAWVKPVGRQMLAEFDVVADGRKPLRLEDIKIVGDGIAIQGRGMLDSRFRLTHFELPKFSIDRVTRLGIEGRLGKGDIWRVAVKGQTFEGRSLFRSLFQAGRAARSGTVAAENQMGIDLEADVTSVLGFWSSKLSNVRMSLSKRQGRIRSMQLEGRLEGDALLKAAIVTGVGGRRELHAFSADAGRAFALVGFYPSARRGRLELVVNMDAAGVADKSGVLLVRDFEIVDEVVGELEQARRQGARRRRIQRTGTGGQALNFNWMRVPFYLGNGQFILDGAELRGPVVGATIEGKADFDRQQVDLSGTYVPLQGLNGAIGVIPGVGQILAGPKGEGILGVKFALQGPMSAPEMLVNPLSMMAPGIFREIFQISSPSLKVTERPLPGAAQQVAPAPRSSKTNNWRAGAFGSQN